MGLLSLSLPLLLFASAFQDFSVFKQTVLKRRGTEEPSREEIRNELRFLALLAPVGLVARLL